MNKILSLLLAVGAVSAETPKLELTVFDFIKSNNIVQNLIESV